MITKFIAIIHGNIRNILIDHIEWENEVDKYTDGAEMYAPSFCELFGYNAEEYVPIKELYRNSVLLNRKLYEMRGKYYA